MREAIEIWMRDAECELAEVHQVAEAEQRRNRGRGKQATFRRQAYGPGATGRAVADPIAPNWRATAERLREIVNLAQSSVEEEALYIFRARPKTAMPPACKSEPGNRLMA